MATGGVGNLTVTLGLDAAEFTNGLTKAEAQAKASTDAVVKQFAAIGAAIGAAISIDAFKNMITGAIDAADHLNDLSKKTGIAVATLGGIGFAAGQAGGDLESASAAAGKLNKSLAEAAAGNKEASEAFKVLGISVKDTAGNTKTADVVLAELADKFAGYADGPEKAALALRIFGKAGADIIPLLNDGGAALQENIAYYARYSAVTQEIASQADQFNDTLGKVNLINKSLGTTIAAELLPVLQNLADAYLSAKENSNLFKDAAAALRIVLEALVVTGATIKDTFVGVGDTIGAYAAVAARLIQGDVAGAKEIGAAYREAGEERKKQLDAFNAAVLRTKAPSTGESTPTKDFGTFTRPPSAPRLPGSGADKAASEAARKLKIQLDGQVKIIQDFGRAQQDAYKTGEQYLDGVYQDGLISQRTFFDTQKQVRDAALQDQLSTFDAEIKAQKDFIKNKDSSDRDREGAEQKIKLLLQQRQEAVTKASAAEILATQANARAVEDLQRSYADLRVSVLEAGGKDSDQRSAAQIRNAQALKDAAILLQRVQGDPAVLGALEKAQDLQFERAKQQRDYALLLDDTSRKEQEIYLDAAAAGQGELDTLAAIRDSRKASIAQIQAQADAARQLALASGKDSDIKHANDLALAYKKALGEIDPLAKQLNQVFEDSFANSFASFIEGTKSAKEAFQDFAKSILSELSKLAAKDIAKSIFGTDSGQGGAGGFLSGLFGGKSSGGSGGGLGSLFGAAGSLFGGFNFGSLFAGSGGATAAASSSDLLALFGAAGYGLATGTDYVPYDGFKATLHRGEKVVPARYNSSNPTAQQPQGGDSGRRAPQTIIVNPPAGMTTKGGQQFAAELARQLAVSDARNN